MSQEWPKFGSFLDFGSFLEIWLILGGSWLILGHSVKFSSFHGIQIPQFLAKFKMAHFIELYKWSPSHSHNGLKKLRDVYCFTMSMVPRQWIKQGKTNFPIAVCLMCVSNRVLCNNWYRATTVYLQISRFEGARLGKLGTHLLKIELLFLI